MWEQIRRNRRKAIWLLMFMSILMAALGYVGGEIIARGAGPFGLLVAGAIFTGQMLVYYISGESLLLMGLGARPLSRDESPRLHNIVEEMQLASGLGYTPDIYMIDSDAPNAFAFGRTPERSGVAVTRGLMYRLSRDELQGVIAHEIAHLKNLDAKFLTLAGVMLGTTVMMADAMGRLFGHGFGRGNARLSSRRGGSSEGGGHPAFIIIGILLIILGPLLARVLYFAVSRSREYLADACAAQYTRYPAGLASALLKISGSLDTLTEANKVNSAMFIINPLAAGGDSGGIFSTHPPTSQRIAILSTMGGGASLASYESAYEKINGRSLMKQQTLAEAGQVSVRQPSDDGPILTREQTRETIQHLHGYTRIDCTCGAVLKIPSTYYEPEVRCIRCGARNAVPPVQERLPLKIPSTISDIKASKASSTAALPPLEYTRTSSGWESIPCDCGGTVQLSPAFSAPFIDCRSCGRKIKVIGR